jgi:hypothetical protein
MLSAFRQQGRRDWCDKVGVSVAVGVEQTVLQSFQSNNSFEKTWGKGGRPGLHEGFVGVSFCVGVGLRRWRGTPEMQKPGGGCGPDTPCSHAEKY